MEVRARGWYGLPLRATLAACGAGLGWAASPGPFLGGGCGSVCPRREKDPCNLLYRCPQAQIFQGDPPQSPAPPRPWGHGWARGSRGDGDKPCPEPSPTPRGKLRFGVPQGPHPASCPRRSEVRCPANRRCFRGAFLNPRSPSPGLPGPRHPACQPGAGSGAGWRGHGRRPRSEGQTGEAGTGTASPLVNSAGPCSLFKALNGGWYLSSPEFGAGGVRVGAGLTRSGLEGWGERHAAPDGSMWGVSPAATCPSSPSRPPFAW